MSWLRCSLVIECVAASANVAAGLGLILASCESVDLRGGRWTSVEYTTVPGHGQKLSRYSCKYWKRKKNYLIGLRCKIILAK